MHSQAKSVKTSTVGNCLIVLGLTLLSGCAFVRGNYGTEIHGKDVQGIKKGVSTRSEVAAILGAPDRIIEVNGHEIYQYLHYDIKSGLFFFFSRTNIKSDDVYVMFNSAGIVDELIFGKDNEELKFQVWPFGD